MSILRRTVTATTSRIQFENQTPHIEVRIGPALESSTPTSPQSYKSESKHNSKRSSLSSGRGIPNGHCSMKKGSSIHSSKETLASSASKQTINSLQTLESQHTVASQHSNTSQLPNGQHYGSKQNGTSQHSLASQATVTSSHRTTKSSGKGQQTKKNGGGMFSLLTAHLSFKCAMLLRATGVARYWCCALMVLRVNGDRCALIERCSVQNSASSAILIRLARSMYYHSRHYLWLL